MSDRPPSSSSRSGSRGRAKQAPQLCILAWKRRERRRPSCQCRPHAACGVYRIPFRSPSSCRSAGWRLAQFNKNTCNISLSVCTRSICSPPRKCAGADSLPGHRRLAETAGSCAVVAWSIVAVDVVNVISGGCGAGAVGGGHSGCGANRMRKCALPARATFKRQIRQMAC